MSDKYNFTTKLFEACGNDENRPIMNCVHFTNGFAYASNGYIVVKQTLNLHSILGPKMLDGKSLHRDNYKACMQFDFATANDDGIQCKDTDGREAFFNYFDRQGAEVPDFDKIINEFTAKPVNEIGFSPEYVKMIIAALHTPDGSIRINFGGLSKMMFIDVLGVEDQCAVLMPVILEPKLF